MPKNRLVTRRRALWLGLTSLTSIGAIATAGTGYRNYQMKSLDNPKRDFTVVGSASLKERAAVKGLIYGSAARQYVLSSNPKWAASFAQECGILVPEWELKWHALRPAPDKFDWSAADGLAQFAKAHKMLIRGHTLVWNQALPPWFNEIVNQKNAEKFLVEHIATVTKRYAGQMHSWDVVNEVIEVGHGQPYGLQNSPWRKFLGSDYIDLAFRIAAQGDPKALLVFNDAGLEYDIPDHEAKRTAILKLLEHLKSKGTPIHGLGIQAHLLGHETRFNPKKLRSFLADVASLGLKILITEMDVSDKELPLDPVVRDRIVASAYEDYLSVVLDEKAVIAVLTWGLSDEYTWLSMFPRSDGKPVRPLPFDSNFKPKSAWNAMARAFDKAPKR